MYNGIMDDSGRGSTQAWERPWTTEEMRKQSSHWNLAGDSGLLQFLQDFSQRMISKTHEVEQMVNSLCHETKVTNAKVSNIVNDFHMLSNTQFVESRVYDEDIQENVKDDKAPEKTKQERENEVVEKISSALSLGLTVMDQAFERVEFQDSDSEDEDSPAHREVLLQAKDPYFQRLLPHLIGSQAFLQDDYVGIADISSEDEELKNEKEDSEISSDDESVPEIHSNQLKLPIRDEYESESVSGGSDMFNDRDDKDELFDESSQSSDDEGLLATENRQDEVDKSTHPPLLAEELDASIKQYSQKSPKKVRKNSETQSIKSRQSVRPTSKSVIKAPSEEDLFGTAIPDDEDNELFGKKGGLFSGTGKLFDESQESSGLFAEVPKPNIERKDSIDDKLLTPKSRGYTQSGKKIPVGGVSAVGGNDLFGEVSENGFKKTIPAVEKRHSVAEPPPEKVEPAKVPVAQKQTGGLFDSDDNDDDLFTAPRKPSITSQASKDVKVSTRNKPLKEGAGLFSSDEEDSDLFNISKTTANNNVPTSTEKKKPAGGVSVFGSLANEIGHAIKSKRPQADSDSDTEKSEDISESRDSASLKSHSSYQAKKVGTKDSRSNSVSSNSLFADDPEIDDLFTKKEPVKKPSKISTSLFGDNDEDDFESLFSSKAAPTKSGQSSLPVTAQTKTSAKTLSLFEDIDEEDLFSKKPTTVVSSTAVAVVEKPPIPEKKEAKPEIIKEVPKDIPAPKISLFDDNQDDDLFSTSSKRSQSPGSFDKSPEDKSTEPSKPSEPPKVRSTSLFDDDVLFGGRNEESPEVDIFKSKAAVDKKTDVNENKPAVPTPSPSKKPVGGVALFGGVDLFGGQSSLKPSAISDKEVNESVESDEREPEISNKNDTFKRPPMLKDIKEVSVSFDEPVDTSNTLQSAAKDRVKVQIKRRPPSRRGRQAAATHSGIDQLPESKEEKSDERVRDEPDSSRSVKKSEVETEDRDSPSKSLPNKELATNVAVTSKPTPFLAVSADFRSPSTEEEDLFSIMDPPDKGLLSNTREKVKKNMVSSKPSVEEPIDSDADLFGGGLNPHPVAVESVEPVKETVSNKGPQDLFKKCNKPQQAPKNRSIFDDDEDDDDIFSVNNSKKGTNDNSVKTSLSAKAKDGVITDADVDDIFKSVPSKSEKLPKLSSMSKSIFDDDDDDDSDIFSTKAVPASSSKTNSTGNIKQPSNTTGKRKESLVKKTVKHSTDVFDDPLLAAQNEKD